MRSYIKTGIGVVCVAALCWIGSCKKADTKRDYVNLDTDSSVKARFNFLPGTYWIYRDSLTGRIDSFYVSSNEYPEQSETYVVYKYHIITVSQVNIDGTAPADSSSWVYDFRATKIVVDYNYTPFEYGWKNQIRFEPLFLYPYSYGDLKGKNDSVVCTQIDSFYAIDTMKYYRVARIYHFSDDGTVAPGIVTRTRLSDWFYVNDSVGLLRMKLDHSDHNIHHDWCLIRYNIVR